MKQFLPVAAIVALVYFLSRKWREESAEDERTMALYEAARTLGIDVDDVALRAGKRYVALNWQYAALALVALYFLFGFTFQKVK